MKKKILIVEDSKNIMLMVEKLLTQKGFEVIKAADGVDAMMKVFDKEPDLILLDIVVPKLNGYLVCKGIKSNDKVSKIPVIAMSAKAQDDDMQKAIEAGVSDFLTKPFTPRELLEKINKHMG